MAYIFNGREFAEKKEQVLKDMIALLKIRPKLVTIIVGDDPASLMYVNLKKKAAERIGAELEILALPESTPVTELIEIIKERNLDSSVNGIMVQLPLPAAFSPEDRDKLLNEISPLKDVDGLRNDTGFTPPTAKAVLEVFYESGKHYQSKNHPGIITVVGGNGFIGRQIVRALGNLNPSDYKILIADRSTPDFNELIRNADILISVTGSEGLIKDHMIKENSVIIDVGSPKGDVSPEAYQKAAFVSPVPGGVGPVTVSSLLENLVDSCKV